MIARKSTLLMGTNLLDGILAYVSLNFPSSCIWIMRSIGVAFEKSLGYLDLFEFSKCKIDQ